MFIRDFARLGRASVRVLRHYDAIGLLRPARVDLGSGYRFYEVGQLASVNHTARLAQVEARLHIIEKEGAMAAEDVVVKRIPAVRVAKSPRSPRALNLRALFRHPTAIPGARPTNRAGGLTGAGPGRAGERLLRRCPDGDGVLVHATLPLNADADADAGDGTDTGGEITDLREIARAATIVHRGSMANAMVPVQTLSRWVDANADCSTGYPRELAPRMPEQ